MKRCDRIEKAEYAGGRTLAITFKDGARVDVDFGPWLNAAERTPYEKRYRNTAWFKRFRVLGDHAIMWGDYLIVFASDKLRRRLSPAVRAAE